MDNSTDFIKVEHAVEDMESGTTEPTENDLNISELCRVCATLCTSEAIDLFPETPEITASLVHLFQIKLQEGDGLPTRLCSTCEDEVLHYYKLCQHVQQAQVFLKSRVASNQDPLALPSTTEGQLEQQDTSTSEDIQDAKPVLPETEQPNQDLHNILMSLNSTVKCEPEDSQVTSQVVSFNSAMHTTVLPQSAENVQLFPQSINFNPVNLMPAQFGSEPLIVNLALMPNFVTSSQQNITPQYQHNNSQQIPHSSSQSIPLQSVHSCQLPRLAPKSVDTIPLVHIDPSIHFQCGICKTNFGSQLQLKMHLNMEVKMQLKKLIPCAHCTRQFRKVNLLLVHLMQHIRNSNMQDFTCEICNKSFKDSYGHKNHLRSHWEHRGFKCKLCGESFKYRVSWYTHCQRKHKQVDSQLLEILPKPEEHQETVTQPVETPLIQAKLSQFKPIKPKLYSNFSASE